MNKNKKNPLAPFSFTPPRYARAFERMNLACKEYAIKWGRQEVERRWVAGGGGLRSYECQ